MAPSIYELKENFAHVDSKINNMRTTLVKYGRASSLVKYIQRDNWFDEKILRKLIKKL